MITDVAGLAVGHWTDTRARTGCTVALFPEGAVASGEVRGGAPATREVALLDPTRTVARIDAVLLTGGSAFGLAAADGVMRWCEAAGRGLPTPAGPVPIVVALALYDLAVGDSSVRPGPDEGWAACEAAVAGPQGALPAGGGGAQIGAQIGAGAGAEIDKVLGPGRRRPGGLVQASVSAGAATVAALVAVNAFGKVGAGAATGSFMPLLGAALEHPFGSTTIGLVATDARLDKLGCHLVAQSAHDGLARAVAPAHTRLDGDAFIAASTGVVAADLEQVRAAAAHVVAAAILTLA